MGHAILTKQEDKNPKIPLAEPIPPSQANPTPPPRYGQCPVTLSMFAHWNSPHPCLDKTLIAVTLPMYFHWNTPYPCFHIVQIPVFFSIYVY